MAKLLDRFHDISIKKKLIGFVLVMLIYPIILVIIFGLYNSEKIIKDRFVSYVEIDVKKAKDRITNDMGDMESFFQHVLYNIDVYELLYSKPMADGVKDTITLYKFKRDMEKYLKSTLYAKQEFEFVTMQFDNDSHVYYAAKETGIIDIKSIPTEKFADAIQDKNEVIYYFDQQGGNIYTYLVRPVYNPESFKRIGIMSYRIDNKYMEELVSYTYREPAETTYLYTGDGKKIVSVGGTFDHRLIEDNEIYLEEDGTYQHTVDGYNYYVVVETIQKADLKIISIISTDMLVADTRKVFDLIIILCVISIPVYLIIANMIYSEILSPFNLLVTKMKEIEKGELDTVIDIERKNEIGYLYRSFNSMSKRLKYLVEYVYEEEIARKNAEIAALQSQINPHFLYNTLETINWKAQLLGEQDIAEMIQALSKLMDANMNRNGEKYITVKQEIEYMDSYLFLIQKRFGKKIEYEKLIDNEVLSYKLPKLIIQPLIENAIHHGIEPIGRGKIILTIMKQDKELYIQVKDNGVGITKEQLRILEKTIHQEKYNTDQHKFKRKSIGLNNVYQRLNLIYGKKSNMNIESVVQEGTTVTLSIPTI